LLHEDLSLPTAVLYEDKLAHNLAWMQKFADAYGAKLAPHGKTTMAPKLFARQLNAGAWGITVATALHARVAYEHGVRRVLMANQLVGLQNMAVVSRLLQDPEFEFFCLVDSADHTEMLARYFQTQGQRLNVLVEVGVQGGRTGIRNRDQLKALLSVLSSWKKHIALCGVEVFEGVLSDEASVRALLRSAVDLATELALEQRVQIFERNRIPGNVLQFPFDSRHFCWSELWGSALRHLFSFLRGDPLARRLFLCLWHQWTFPG
jgi:D-serine dehydratase